jgi:K+-transporting ATPase ATPase C chain
MVEKKGNRSKRVFLAPLYNHFMDRGRIFTPFSLSPGGNVRILSVPERNWALCKEQATMMKHLRSSLVMIAAFTVITGMVYPLVVTGLAQLLFPGKAGGSLIIKNGKVRGSELIGQPFSGPGYFWGRLSATTPFAYNAAASAGSNYGPLNPALLEAVGRRVMELKAADPKNTRPVPVDLVTASGSGLDPHISVAAALYQVSRVARHRHASQESIAALVHEYTEGRQLGFLGEPRVNVMKLNLALDEGTTLPEEN